MPLTAIQVFEIAEMLGSSAFSAYQSMVSDLSLATGAGITVNQALEDKLLLLGSPYLVAATILEGLADPSLEGKFNLEDEGFSDTKGQFDAWLRKAAWLRTQAEIMIPLTVGMAGVYAGGSGIPAFRRSDSPLPTGQGLKEDKDWE